MYGLDDLVGNQVLAAVAPTDDDALTHRAKVMGKTRSAVVRELLSKALSDQSIEERAGHLKGSLHLNKPATNWGKQLKKRNWR